MASPLLHLAEAQSSSGFDVQGQPRLHRGGSLEQIVQVVLLPRKAHQCGHSCDLTVQRGKAGAVGEELVVLMRPVPGDALGVASFQFVVDTDGEVDVDVLVDDPAGSPRTPSAVLVVLPLVEADHLLEQLVGKGLHPRRRFHYSSSTRFVISSWTA